MATQENIIIHVRVMTHDSWLAQLSWRRIFGITAAKLDHHWKNIIQQKCSIHVLAQGHKENWLSALGCSILLGFSKGTGDTASAVVDSVLPKASPHPHKREIGSAPFLN
jgi:hypothetical protein